MKIVDARHQHVSTVNMNIYSFSLYLFRVHSNVLSIVWALHVTTTGVHSMRIKKGQHNKLSGRFKYLNTVRIIGKLGNSYVSVR